MEESKQWEYEHPHITAGTPVYILPEIRQIHSGSPIAGKHGVATWGVYHENLPAFEQLSYVPVLVDGHRWYVEQEYVMRSEVSA